MCAQVVVAEEDAAATIGAITGIPTELAGSDGGRSRSRDRRSAGPPRAGSADLVTKASWDSVSDRRGTASRATVRRTSRRAGRLPRITMSAAPVAAPRRRPSPRKASSLAVTRDQVPRCPALPGRRRWVDSVATRFRAVNSCGCPRRASSRRCAAVSLRLRARARACTARGPGGRLTTPEPQGCRPLPPVHPAQDE